MSFILRIPFNVLPIKIEDEAIVFLADSIESISIVDKGIFSCTLCKNTYKSQGYLNTHMKAKHGYESQPNACTMCSKVYNSEKSLKRHLETCTPKQCKLCNFSSRNDDEMKEHKKVHNTCSVCGKSFDYPSKLTRHLKFHNWPYICCITHLSWFYNFNNQHLTKYVNQCSVY